MLKGILFDLDGTLVDFKIDYRRARSETIEILEAHGFPPKQLSADILVLQMLQAAENFFLSKQGRSEEWFKSVKAEIDQKVELVERDAAVQATTLPGMEKILQYALDQNLRIGVLTYNSSTNALITLQTAGLASFFSNPTLVMGRDQAKRPKPDPLHTNALLARLGLDPSEICIIGDHPRDIEAANNVGARSIAIRDKNHPREEYLTPHCVEKENINQILKILADFQQN